MTTKNIATDWTQLLCEYFREICVGIIGNYFLQFCFSWKETSIGGVMFFREDIFVELSYMPETYPTYSLTIIVGIGSDKYGANGTTNGVPLWYLIPQDVPERKYSTWQFSNKAELAIVMERIQVEILDAYVMPLLKDKSKLIALIKDFSKRA